MLVTSEDSVEWRHCRQVGVHNSPQGSSSNKVLTEILGRVEKARESGHLS